jgi:hypothetical protein
MKTGRLIFNFGIGIFLLGILFKYLKNQYAVDLIVFGLTVLLLGYSIKFIGKKEKKFVDFLRLFVLISFCSFIASKLYNGSYSGTLKTVFVFGLYSWLLIEGSKLIRSLFDFSTKRKAFLNSLFLFAILSAILGIVLKYLKVHHHEYAFFVAVIFGVFWFLFSLLKKEKTN